ncbi:MAG: DUF6455 family protein [Methyloligellaceae bacterium]
MNPTPFEIGVALFMVGVSVAIVMWFQRHLAAASARRMINMMSRVGVDPRVVRICKYIQQMHGDPHTESVMKDARYRCRKCMAEDYCDRWIAGKAEGDNSFCPNARTFASLTRTAGHTG